MLSEILDALQAPKNFAWSLIPGLHDDDTGRAYSGSEALSHGLGMDPDSFWTKALGFGADMLGDPMTYLAPAAAGLGMKALGYGAKAGAAADALAGAGRAAEGTAPGLLADAIGSGGELAADAGASIPSRMSMGIQAPGTGYDAAGALAGASRPAAVGADAAASAVPHTNITDLRRSVFLRKAGLDEFGEPVASFHGSAPASVPDDMINRAIESGFNTFQGNPGVYGLHYPEQGVTLIREGLPQEIAKQTFRHEGTHALISNAVRTGDSSRLGLLPRWSANMQMSDNGTMRGMGAILDEIAAHGQESDSLMHNIGRIGGYLASGDSGYADAIARAGSPRLSQLYGAVPDILRINRYGLAGAGLAGGLGAAIGFNRRPHIDDADNPAATGAMLGMIPNQ